MAQQRFWPHQLALIENLSAVFFLPFVYSSGAAFFIPSIIYVWKNMKVWKLPQLEIFVYSPAAFQWMRIRYFSIDLSQGSFCRIFHSHRGSAGKTWVPESIWLVVMWFFVYCDWWCKLCGYVGQDVFAKMQWWSIPQPNLNKWGLGVVQTSVLTNRIIHPNSTKNLSITVSGWHL